MGRTTVAQPAAPGGWGPEPLAGAAAALSAQATKAGLRHYRESLDDLPPAVAQAMRERGHQRRWQRGQVVVLQSQPLDAVVVGLHGRLDVMLAAPSGRNTLLRWLRPGEIVGLSTALAQLPFQTTIVAHGAATTLHVQRQVFLDILQQHPEGAIAVAVLLSRRLSELFRYVEKTAHRPLPERVRYALQRLARLHGEPVADGQLKLKITQADLANAAGASRQRVHLELLRLQAAGVLTLGYRVILVRRDALA